MTEAPKPPPRLRPPFVALVLVLVAWLIDGLMRAERVISWPWAWLGALAIGAGLALIAWSIGLFHRAGTTHDPREEPTALVVSGPYRFTRNPMYLGLTTILLGIGVLAGSWPFLLLPPIVFPLLMNAFWIPREERVLSEAFGPEYEGFRRRVRRWL